MPTESYRLPRHTVPHRYDLELRPDLGASRFEGTVAIGVEVLEPTDRLVLHAADLTVTAAELEGVGQPAIGLNPEEQQLWLDFAAPLRPGHHRLNLDFSGVLNDDLRGFYRSTFTDPSGDERVIATTQFEATDARRAFPCWDEPEFKATFAVTLVVDEGLTALSNGAVVSTGPRPGGRVEWRFAETIPMSTYLVAFIVGPFEATEAVVVDGVPLRVAAIPGRGGQTAYPLEVAAHALRFLRQYFGIPYPAAKLDHVAIPDFAMGAMENLGCVTYRESLLLADRERAATAELQQIANVISHETAHMWFGDLVTMRWWNGIWLNEAFATFMEQTTVDAFRPDWQVWATFGAGKNMALVTDGLHATRPVEYPVGRPEEAEGMFDVLTYQKGGSVLKMLEQFLGPDTFRKGISQYLSAHAYGNTETDDLWEALAAVSGQPVKEIMHSWIDQGGYPLVSAELDADGATVALRQRRFLYDGGSDPARWSVPVNLRASVGGTVHHERLLLDSESGSFSFPGPVDWVVVNDGGSGFYRSRYSPGLWDRLFEGGALATFNPIERLQFLSDTWAGVLSGSAGLHEWARAARALAGDPDPDVWASLLGSLRLLDRVATGTDRDALRSFADRLTGPSWAAVGWEGGPGEGERVANARGRILTARAEFAADPGLIAEARQRFEAYLAGSPLAPDLVGPAARVFVGSGTPGDWRTVRDAYLRATDIQERLRFLHSLPRATDDDQRRETLELAAGPEVRSQDSPFVIGTMVTLPAAAAVAWDWIEEHWPRIAARIPAALHIRLLEVATEGMVDPILADRLTRFLDSGAVRASSIRLRQLQESAAVSVAAGRRLQGGMAAPLGG